MCACDGALWGWRTEVRDLRAPKLSAVRGDGFGTPTVAEQAEGVHAVVLRKGGDLVSPMKRMRSESVNKYNWNAFVTGVDVVDFERSRAWLCSCPCPLVPTIFSELHTLSALHIHLIFDSRSDWLLVIK